MVTSTNHVISGRIYFALGPWHFGDFRNIFLPNIGEEQKKSYDFNSGTLAGTQARSQKFTMGGAVLGVWRRSLQRSKILHFFAKWT